MAWKHDLLLLAAFWSILVQPTPIEPEVVPQVTPTPAMPRLSPVLHLENPQATLAPTSHLTASAATFKLSSSFPFATPRVYLRAVTSPECYYPDGSVAQDFNYTADPNLITSGHAPCCDKTLGDQFLPGGLCWFPSTPQHGAYVYRAACTDRTFKSDRCAQVCKLNTPNRWESLIFCAKTNTFCCQQAAESGSCCDDPDLPVEVPEFPDSIMSSISEIAAEETGGLPAGTNTFGSSSTPTSTPASTTPSETSKIPPLTTLTTISSTRTPSSTSISTPTASSRTSPQKPTPTSGGSKGGLSTENKISLGLGLGLGVPTLMATIYMCVRYSPANVKRGVEHYIFDPVAHGVERYIVDPVSGWWAPSSKDLAKVETHEMA